MHRFEMDLRDDMMDELGITSHIGHIGYMTLEFTKTVRQNQEVIK